MRSTLRMLAALVVFIGASLTVAGPAAAVPTVAFSFSSVGLTVGEPATYTADVVCDEEPCRYQWHWYRVLGNDRLGTTVGEGPELTYAFSTADLKNVVLKVTNATRTHGFAVASQVLRVMSDTGAPVDPPIDPPVDPPVDQAPPVDEPPLPPVEEPTPVETTTVPTLVDPPAPVPDETTVPSTDPAAPPADSTCPAPADPPAPDPATPTEPAADPVDPICTEPADPSTESMAGASVAPTGELVR